jgi:hypothetical protein
MNKLESKVVLMNELLDSARDTYLSSTAIENGPRGKAEKMVKGDVYDVRTILLQLRFRLIGYPRQQVSKALIDARPKLQKLIADAGAAATGEGGEGDSESLGS